MGFADMARKVLKEIEEARDSSPCQAEPGVRSTDRPYMDSEGDLVIPFDSDPKYHWWLGSHCVFTNAMGSGQSVEETLKEITGKTVQP